MKRTFAGCASRRIKHAFRPAGVDVTRTLHVGTVVVAVGGVRTFQLPRGRLRPAPTPDSSAARRTLGPQLQGRASKTILKGVSVALRTLPNPPCVIADDSLAKPACAPSAAPTGWSSEVGTQIMVEAA